MPGEINGVKVPFIPITPGEELKQNRTVSSGDQFRAIFQQELDRLKFSNHAVQRLETRNIDLSEAEIQKLNHAVEKAEAKGCRDSLIMMNNTAFIVNIPNRTVITAVPVDAESENIFTNIDSVVFAF